MRLQKVELEGTFGRVFNGMYTKEDGSEESVLVKTVMGKCCIVFEKKILIRGKNYQLITF